MLDKIDSWMLAKTQTLVDWAQQPLSRLLKGLAYGFGAACFTGIAAQYGQLGWTAGTVYRAVIEPICAVLMLAMASHTPFGVTSMAVAARLSVLVLSVGSALVQENYNLAAVCRITADLFLILYLYIGSCKPPAPKQKRHNHKLSYQ